MISQLHLLFPASAFAGVYDFSGGSSDTDRVGWYASDSYLGLNADKNPDAMTGQIAFSTGAYAKFVSSDGAHYISTTTAATDIIHHFKFVISEATNTITQIYVEWVGKGKTDGGSNQDCGLKLYQFPSTGGLQIGSYTGPISQITLSSAITSDYQRFIDTTTKRIDVYVTGGYESTLPAEIWTDYVKVVISSLDGTSPAAADLAAATGADEGEIDLTWTAPGDDGASGDISGGKFAVQYSTYAVSWSTASAQIVNSTSTTVGAVQSRAVTGLTAGATYYFRLWSADEVPNWSDLSNGATAQAGILSTNITEVSFDFGEISLGSGAVSSSSATVINTGNLNATYRIKLSTPTGWNAGTAPDMDQFVFYAMFNSAAPSAGAFGDEDILSTTTVSCDATVFAGDVTGVNIPPGEKRGMWAYFKAPPATTVETQQGIIVTITPGKP